MSHELLDSQQLISQRRKLVAKIGLSVGLASCAILLIMLTLITNDSGQSYGAIISSHALTKRQLGPAMTIAGLVLLTFTGILTWFIALYSSFRVAGPLYRLAENFKQATSNSANMEILPIRESDAIQHQAKVVQQAITGLHEHYAAMKQAADEAAAALSAGDNARYIEAVTKLRSLDEKARI